MNERYFENVLRSLKDGLEATPIRDLPQYIGTVVERYPKRDFNRSDILGNVVFFHNYGYLSEEKESRELLWRHDRDQKSVMFIRYETESNVAYGVASKLKDLRKEDFEAALEIRSVKFSPKYVKSKGAKVDFYEIANKKFDETKLFSGLVEIPPLLLEKIQKGVRYYFGMYGDKLWTEQQEYFGLSQKCLQSLRGVPEYKSNQPFLDVLFWYLESKTEYFPVKGIGDKIETKNKSNKEQSIENARGLSRSLNPDPVWKLYSQRYLGESLEYDIDNLVSQNKDFFDVALAILTMDMGNIAKQMEFLAKVSVETDRHIGYSCKTEIGVLSKINSKAQSSIVKLRNHLMGSMMTEFYNTTLSPNSKSKLDNMTINIALAKRLKTYLDEDNTYYILLGSKVWYHIDWFLRNYRLTKGEGVGKEAPEVIRKCKKLTMVPGGEIMVWLSNIREKMKLYNVDANVWENPDMDRINELQGSIGTVKNIITESSVPTKRLKGALKGPDDSWKTLIEAKTYDDIQKLAVLYKNILDNADSSFFVNPDEETLLSIVDSRFVRDIRFFHALLINILNNDIKSKSNTFRDIVSVHFKPLVDNISSKVTTEGDPLEMDKKMTEATRNQYIDEKQKSIIVINDRITDFPADMSYWKSLDDVIHTKLSRLLDERSKKLSQRIQRLKDNARLKGEFSVKTKDLEGVDRVPVEATSEVFRNLNPHTYLYYPIVYVKYIKENRDVADRFKKLNSLIGRGVGSYRDLASLSEAEKPIRGDVIREVKNEFFFAKKKIGDLLEEAKVFSQRLEAEVNGILSNGFTVDYILEKLKYVKDFLVNSLLREENKGKEDILNRIIIATTVNDIMTAKGEKDAEFKEKYVDLLTIQQPWYDIASRSITAGTISDQDAGALGNMSGKIKQLREQLSKIGVSNREALEKEVEASMKDLVKPKNTFRDTVQNTLCKIKNEIQTAGFEKDLEFAFRYLESSSSIFDKLIKACLAHNEYLLAKSEMPENIRNDCNRYEKMLAVYSDLTDKFGLDRVKNLDGKMEKVVRPQHINVQGVQKSLEGFNGDMETPAMKENVSKVFRIGMDVVTLKLFLDRNPGLECVTILNTDVLKENLNDSRDRFSQYTKKAMEFEKFLGEFVVKTTDDKINILRWIGEEVTKAYNRLEKVIKENYTSERDPDLKLVINEISRMSRMMKFVKAHFKNISKGYYESVYNTVRALL